MEILILTIVLFIDLKISRCQVMMPSLSSAIRKVAVPALLELKSYERSNMCRLSIKAFPKNPDPSKVAILGTLTLQVPTLPLPGILVSALGKSLAWEWALKWLARAEEENLGESRFGAWSWL